MDEHTPIDVPIRLEEWDRHDCINEVDTIVVDVRPILDATDYGHLPAPDDWTADFSAGGWPGTHRTSVEGGGPR